MRCRPVIQGEKMNISRRARQVAACAAYAAAILPLSAIPVRAQVVHEQAAHASVNAGTNAANPDKPFDARTVATFNTPWSIAFMADGRMLVTEKRGRLYRVTQQGAKQEIGGVPSVSFSGQNGLLDVALAPTFARDQTIYLTYSEPGKGGSSLALARARLAENAKGPTLENLQVIWRQNHFSLGGQPGGIIAFSPDGKYLFLTSGDRMDPDTAQDPDQAPGKVLRLNLDGSTPPDNPWASQGGVRAQTWTLGHRNPYGLAFAPDGRLWLDEMGPKGGDELNVLKAGRNYGWALVSNGDNYNGTPIPRHGTRPDFEAPFVYWTPVIAPAGLVFYTGDMFPAWKGSAFIGGLAAQALVRIAFDDKGGAREADRWDMGERIRDVAMSPDGALWLVEDGSSARLLRLTPKKQAG
jgi:glucose/arabinose dehydrogenase